MKIQRYAAGAAGLLLLLAGALSGQEDKGETPEALKLRGRTAAPAAADIDPAVTIPAMLSRGEKSAFSEAKGATIEGWVVQVEREDDGDYHVALAESPNESDTRKWVIVEVTPGWQKKNGALAGDGLRKLNGKKVRVTGWLYYEPDADQPDPRGTRWELHPVTDVAVVAGATR
jgi:hypothetical protein